MIIPSVEKTGIKGSIAHPGAAERIIDHLETDFLTADGSTDAEFISLDTSPTIGDFVEGKVFYDENKETVSAMIGGGVTLAIGQDDLILVYNDSGSTITKGKVVYITDAYLGRKEISLAKADIITNSSILGIVTEDITFGSTGYVTNRGMISGLDTFAFFTAAPLYLSDLVLGGLTATAPTDESSKVVMVAYNVVSSLTEGEIYVNIVQNNRIADLNDAEFTDLLIDQILKYNGTHWINSPQTALATGAGTVFFLDSTPIIPSSTQSIEAFGLLKFPIASSEVTTSTIVNNSTSLLKHFLYDSSLGGSQIDAGVWRFDTFATVDSITDISSIVTTVRKNATQTGTLSIAGIGTTRTATSSVAVFSPSDYNADTSLTGLIQTPNALFRIIGYISSTSVSIETLTTYTNESSVAYSKHDFLFTDDNEINNTAPSIVSSQTVQAPFAINSTDKLSISYYAKTDSLSNKTVTLYQNGTLHASLLTTPLVARHNDLVGLQGGAADEKYHLTLSKYNIVQNTSGVNTGDQDLSGKLNNSMNTGFILGRNTGGVGIIEEISIGGGLTLAGGILSGTSPSVLTFVFSGTNSSISGYETMPSLSSYTAGVLATKITSVTTTPTLLEEFATDAGFPNITTIPIGTMNFHYETQKGAGGANYYSYVELYKRNLAGTETLLLTSDNSSVLAVNTLLQVTVSALVASPITLLSTDRLVIKIYAVMSTGGSQNITLRWDDNTDARMELPFVTADATNFVPYTGSTADINLNTHNITMPSGAVKDAAGLDSFAPNNRALLTADGIPNVQFGTYELFDSSTVLSQNWSGRYLFDSTGALSTAYSNRQLISTSGNATFDWESSRAADPFGNQSAQFDNRQLLDGTGITSANWLTRQLLDAGGFYPSIDWGLYQLLDIGTSNSGPMLGWGNSYGGGVKIFYGSSALLVADFTTQQLYNADGYITLDFHSKYLYDNFNTVSLDWEYKTLNANYGTISFNWDSRQAFYPSGNLAIDYSLGQLFSDIDPGSARVDFSNNYYLKDSSGVNSVLWQSRYLSNNSGNAIFDWSGTHVKAFARMSISSTLGLNPISALHIDSGTTTASAIKLTAGTTTGQTATDGFDIGITSSGVAEIRQRENLNLEFYQNNALRMQFLNTGTCDASGTSQFRGANGTAAAPTWSFASDTTKGMYHSAANQLSWSIASTERMRLSSTGLLSIYQGTALRGAMATVYSQTNSVGNVGVGEDTLHTVTTASGSFTNNGDSFEVKCSGTFAANANLKRLKLKFGSITLFDTTALAFNTGDWQIDARIFRTTTTTGKSIVTWTCNNVTLTTTCDYQSWAFNFLTTNALFVTGEATADNDIVQELMQVFWVPVA